MNRRKFLKSMFIFTGGLWIPKYGIARINPAIIGSPSGDQDGAPAVTADVLVDFENGNDEDLITTTILGNSTHPAAPGGTWSISPSPLTDVYIETSAEKTTHSTFSIGGTNYDDASGTRGMKYNFADGAKELVDFDLTTHKTAMSFGFLFYTCNAIPVDDSAGVILAGWTDSGGGDLAFRLYHERDASGNYRFRIRGAGLSSAINVSPATWYWITILYGIGVGAIKMRVYNTTTWEQVGAEVTQDGTATYDISNIYIGQYEAGHTRTDVCYWDDVVWDWTDATYPLGP